MYAITQVIPDHFEHKISKSLFSMDIIYKKEERPFISELDKYVKHSEFFVNSDHEEQFAQSYPDLYAKIDTLTEKTIFILQKFSKSRIWICVRKSSLSLPFY